MRFGKKRILKIASAVLLIVVIVASSFLYIFYQDLKKELIEKATDRASSAIGQKVDIGDISFSILSGINVNDISVKNPEGFPEGQLLNIKNINLNIKFMELFHGVFYFRDIGIISPELTLIKDNNNKINVSDKLMVFLTKKSTAKYHVDELSMTFGKIGINKDEQFRNEQINLKIKNLSSEQDVKTLISLNLMALGGNKFTVEGWAYPKTETKTFSVSLKAKDLSLSEFRDMFNKYKIDTDKIAVDMQINADGDMKDGISIKSGLKIKHSGYFNFTRNIKDIELKSDSFFNIQDGIFAINEISLDADDASEIQMKGIIRDIFSKPNYTADLRIKRLDISGFNFLKGIKVSGVIASDNINIKSGPDSLLPEISGSINIINAGVKTGDADVDNINAKAVFSYAKKVSIKADAKAKILKAKDYMVKPADIKLSAEMKGRNDDITFIVSAGLAPIDVKAKGDKAAHADNFNINTNGRLKGKKISAVFDFNAEGIKYDGRVVNALKGSMNIKYEKDLIALNDLKIDAGIASLTADQIDLSIPVTKEFISKAPSPLPTGQAGSPSRGEGCNTSPPLSDQPLISPPLRGGDEGEGDVCGFTNDRIIKDQNHNVKARNMHIFYPEEKAEAKKIGLDMNFKINKERAEGNIIFSAGEISMKDIRIGSVAGRGNLFGDNFVVELTDAVIAGGNLKLNANGKLSGSHYPIKIKATAANIDAGIISKAVEGFIKMPYSVAGNIRHADIDLTADSAEILHGKAGIDAEKISVLKTEKSTGLLKNGFLKAGIDFIGKDIVFTADAGTGSLHTKISGRASAFAAKDREIKISASLPNTKPEDIRNSFWDIFPDKLLYAGMDGSISADISAGYNNAGFSINGDLKLKDLKLEGENNEYSVGPINGEIPFSYGKNNEEEAVKKEFISQAPSPLPTGQAGSPSRGEGYNISPPLRGGDEGEGDVRGFTHDFISRMPAFERSNFEDLKKYYSQMKAPTSDHKQITIGLLSYGFRLIEDIHIQISRKTGFLNITGFSGNIFGGKIYGAASADFRDQLNYRAGIIMDGLSMTKLCEEIEPIKGYITGRVDGVANFKGNEGGIKQLIGKADFWTYSKDDEKTKISKEFLLKIGGPAVKTYLGDRKFNKGILRLYIKDGFMIFEELEISNRNFFGITDLSVKVAPFNNRISIDHLMWTMTETAQRAKGNK